jgi:hypothetical protein
MGEDLAASTLVFFDNLLPCIGDPLQKINIKRRQLEKNKYEDRYFLLILREKKVVHTVLDYSIYSNHYSLEKRTHFSGFQSWAEAANLAKFDSSN